MYEIGKDVEAMFQEVGDREKPPEGLTIPLIPISDWDKASILINDIRIQLCERMALRRLPRFLAQNPGWCADVRRRARSAGSRAELIALYGCGPTTAATAP